MRVRYRQGRGVAETEPQIGRLVTSSSLVMLPVKRWWRDEDQGLGRGLTSGARLVGWYDRRKGQILRSMYGEERGPFNAAS